MPTGQHKVHRNCEISQRTGLDEEAEGSRIVVKTGKDAFWNPTLPFLLGPFPPSLFSFPFKEFKAHFRLVRNSFCFFRDKVSGRCQDGLEFLTLLPQPPKSWSTSLGHHAQLGTDLYSNTSHKGSTEGGTVAATKSGSCQGLSLAQKDSVTPQIPQGKYVPTTSAHAAVGQPTPGIRASSQPSLPASYDQLLAEFCLPVFKTICVFRLFPLNKTTPTCGCGTELGRELSRTKVQREVTEPW